MFEPKLTFASDWPEVELRQGPLSGIRILDLSRILAGPYASMNLADLGADVIKVEAPGRGDETRHWGPPFTPDGTASYFLAVNHNKRSLTLGLKDRSGSAIARHLATYADVIIDNFLPGKMQAFGLSREHIDSMNPRAITATISGFGADNPYAGRPGFDFLAQAMGGLMSITGEKDGMPIRVGVAVNDLMAGLHAALGIVAALQERDRTGIGRQVDIGLLDTQVAMLANIASGWLNAGAVPKPFGNRHPSIAPYETLETADKPLAVAVGTDRQFRLMCQALGAPEIAEDSRFSSNLARVSHREALVEVLENLLRNDGRDQWLSIFTAGGVPAAPVNTVPEVFADPVIQDRMVVLVDGIRQVRSPLRLDGKPLAVDTAPHSLGQDSCAILAQLGLSDRTIKHLLARGAI